MASGYIKNVWPVLRDQRDTFLPMLGSTYRTPALHRVALFFFFFLAVASNAALFVCVTWHGPCLAGGRALVLCQGGELETVTVAEFKE